MGHIKLAIVATMVAVIGIAACAKRPADTAAGPVDRLTCIAVMRDPVQIEAPSPGRWRLTDSGIWYHTEARMSHTPERGQTCTVEDDVGATP